MKTIVFGLTAAATLFAAGGSQTFTGVISDSMCVGNHATMHVSPDAKCVRECVKSGGVKYVLFDGRNTYRLSDQQTPAEFAGRQVKIVGTLYPKTGIIQVEKIEPLNGR